MIVDDGKIALLDAQRTYLSGLVWGLFTNNLAEDRTKHFADLVEAAWTSYVRVGVGTLFSPLLVGTRAQTQPTGNPSFTNGTGATVHYFGWFLYDPTAAKLVAYVNLGDQTIPAGGTITLAPIITDTQE